MPLLKSRLRWGPGARGMKGYPKNDTKTFTITLKGDGTNIDKMLTETVELVKALNFEQNELKVLVKQLFPTDDDGNNEVIHTLLDNKNTVVEIKSGSIIILIESLISSFKKQNDVAAINATNAIIDITLTADGSTDDGDAFKVVNSVDEILNTIRNKIPDNVKPAALEVIRLYTEVTLSNAEDPKFDDFFVALSDLVATITAK